MDQLIAHDRTIVEVGSKLDTCIARYLFYIHNQLGNHTSPETIGGLRKELQDTYNEFRRCCITHDNYGDAGQGAGVVYYSAPEGLYTLHEPDLGQCWTCGTRVDTESQDKGKEKEERQYMSARNDNNIHGISLSVAMGDQATRVPGMRTEDKDVVFNADDGRDQCQRVISTQVVTINAVDVGLAPQLGQDTISYHIQISVLEGGAGNQ
ncbi:hypothetical protein RUND412_002521 [Rhizina undulata]